MRFNTMLRHGLEVFGTLIGISTEEQPSAHNQKPVGFNQGNWSSGNFAETTINPALIKTVAQESGAKLAPRSLYSLTQSVHLVVTGIPTSRWWLLIHDCGSLGKYTPFQ